MKVIRILILFVVLLVWHDAATATVTSTFDSSLEGWTLAGNPALSHQATGGNPGGFARYDDTPGVEGDGWIVAPSEYLGEWSWLDGVGWLAWDHKILDPGEGGDILDGQAKISGPGGSAIYYSGSQFTEQWQSFSASIAESAWLVTDGSWGAVLANVTELQIRIESVHNDGPTLDIDGIDNVALVPEPSSLALLLIGAVALRRRARDRSSRRSVVSVG